MSLARVENISLSRGHRQLIRELSFSLIPGQITVVLGPNGAGKSSLLLALAGLLPYDAGSILLQGNPLDRMNRRQIAGLVAWQGDMPSVEFGLTVSQRLQLARDHGLSKEEGNAMEETCALLEIEHLLQRKLGDLSAGERQRTELAATVVRETPLWLLDEPVVHLDLKHQKIWFSLMRHYARAGKAMLTVLHDVQQACTVADEAILIFADGCTRFGSADAMLTAEILEELYQTPLSQFADASGRKIIIPSYGD
ncbi:MAG: ABC transporter ATP-binding protein [Mariprofundaceae bacterium]